MYVGSDPGGSFISNCSECVDAGGALLPWFRVVRPMFLSFSMSFFSFDGGILFVCRCSAAVASNFSAADSTTTSVVIPSGFLCAVSSPSAESATDEAGTDLSNFPPPSSGTLKALPLTSAREEERGLDEPADPSLPALRLSESSLSCFSLCLCTFSSSFEDPFAAPRVALSA